MRYGRLTDNGLELFKAYRGGIHADGKVIFTKSESVYNNYGWYRIENVEDDGEDYLDGNIIKHYIGKPITEEENEPIEESADGAE